MNGTSSLASETEATIRGLETAEVHDILAGNVLALEQTWHPDYLVNAPNNKVVSGGATVAGLVTAGVIAYHRFERNIEAVAVHGDVAVAMGSETVQPKSGPHAGQVIQRRYSNLWRKADGGWRMIAPRQFGARSRAVARALVSLGRARRYGPSSRESRLG